MWVVSCFLVKKEVDEIGIKEMTEVVSGTMWNHISLPISSVRINEELAILFDLGLYLMPALNCLGPVTQNNSDFIITI